MYFCTNIKDHCHEISLIYDGTIFGIYMVYGVGFCTHHMNMEALLVNLHVMFCQYIM